MGGNSATLRVEGRKSRKHKRHPILKMYNSDWVKWTEKGLLREERAWAKPQALESVSNLLGVTVVLWGEG